MPPEDEKRNVEAYLEAIKARRGVAMCGGRVGYSSHRVQQELGCSDVKVVAPKAVLLEDVHSDVWMHSSILANTRILMTPQEAALYEELSG